MPRALLDDRLILITGASRGLGAALAEACARAGARLILTARTRGGLEETDDRVRAAGSEATLVPLDLAQGELVDKLGRAIFDRHGKLDGLLACAADLGKLSPVPHLDPKALAQLFTLNVLANQRLIRALDPLLRASDAGRAVFLTDHAASVGPAFWGGYGASKAALEALVRAWAAETRISRLKVNLVDPGPMRTKLREQAFPGITAAETPEPATLAPLILPLLSAAEERHGELIRLGG